MRRWMSAMTEIKWLKQGISVLTFHTVRFILWLAPDTAIMVNMEVRGGVQIKSRYPAGDTIIMQCHFVPPPISGGFSVGGYSPKGHTREGDVIFVDANTGKEINRIICRLTPASRVKRGNQR